MKTVIFDMDGVLVDSEPLYADAWIQVYKEIGIGIDHDYYFSKICGKHGLISTRMVLEEFCRHEENIDKKNLNFRKEQISAALVKERISPMPGAVRERIQARLSNNFFDGVCQLNHLPYWS